MKNIDLIIPVRSSGDYQRENFDRFLCDISFEYLIPSVHIAGTNGKGSTASYLASIYKEAGYKVGLFMSPGLNQVNEMISVDDELISDEEIEDIIQVFKQSILQYELSAFEILSLIALPRVLNCYSNIPITERAM